MTRCMSKIVRFYEPIHVDMKGTIRPLTSQFWTELRNSLSQLPHKDRESEYRGSIYYGEAKRARRPALPYLHIGRLRDRSDWPNTYEPDTGEIADLELATPELVLVERTYLVPFGSHDLVAIVSPLGAASFQAIQRWLTEMCDLTLSDSLIELRPFIDEAVIRKLNERAVGVTKLSVPVPSDAEVEQQGGGQVGRALRNAVNDNTPDLTISMKWSFERTRGSDAGRRGLLEAAR